jgi:hypothetical protein
MITIENLLKERNNNLFMGFSGVEGPTPIEIVNTQINEMTIDWGDISSRYLFPASGYLTYSVVVYWKLFESLRLVIKDDNDRRRHILENMLYLSEINPYLCHYALKQGFINVIEGDYLKYKTKMKFDAILGNPPYQIKVGETNTEPIWDKFVLKSFELVKEGGFVSLIHPSGWRSPKGRFKKIQNLLRSKRIHFLSLNDFNDGQKMFGVGTNFDFYCVQNIDDDSEITKVISIDKEIFHIDLNRFNFIPNGMFDLFKELIADDNEEKVDIVHSESFYAHRKEWMSKEISDEFQHPCVYTITKSNGMNFYYSRVNDKGHFGIPKVIWSNGLGTYPIIDRDGRYGLMEYSFGISDIVENLDNIKMALESENMLKLMTYVKFTNNKYDSKVIATFKKDFWRYFINE